MDFFKQFSEAQWEFTYGAPDKPETHNALQVGLVAYFYINQGYLLEKRLAIAKALAIYDREFGKYLTWGFINDSDDKFQYSSKALQRLHDELTSSDGEALDFAVASERGLSYASNYFFSVGSPADWFEMLHHSVSYVSFYLPVEEIDHGVSKFEQILVEICDTLGPMHGLAGLGIQQSLEYHTYQHIEYEIGQEFLAVDITNSNDNARNRNGIRTINWYTFIQNKWLDKLGGEEQLKATLNDDRIKLIPYSGGLIIRAGEWPELGWVKRNPYPELYVKVNNALKPIRAPEIGSMGYGSIAGEIRFNKRTTAEWLKRFDNAPLPPPEEKPKETQKEKFRITLWTGEPAPHAGLWATLNKRGLEYVTVKKGESLPPWFDNEQQIHRTQWTLLERDDGGPVEFDKVVKE